jgi:hypothetical protein
MRRGALLAVAAVVGCGGDEGISPQREVSDASPVAHTATLDERRGTWRAIGIGSTRRDVQRALGRVRNGDPLAPLGRNPLPTGVPPGPDTPRGKTPGQVWRATDAALVAHRNRAWLLVISAQGVVTRRGVGIGDTLDEVRKAYPHFRCEVANKNTEYVQIEFCTGRVAHRRYLWFGHDPVISVTVSEAALR